MIFAALLLTACQAQTEHHSIEVPMSIVNDQGAGEQVGTITISETPYGLLFTPDLKNLPGGLHGFHIHEHANCAAMEKDHVMTAALAAGGHFDPQKTGQHLGPYGAGHLGDLPALYVDNQGIAQTPVLAPRIKTLTEINHTALMIHVGGDNYSDHPNPLGGGGMRMVCGVINE
ncbi:MAG: superoxide dismutase [Cu-Zn] SodC [Gammaproteobacteria bacterium]